MNNASVFTCYDHFLHDLPFAAKSKKLTTSRSIRTRASLAWAYLYHYSNPYIKKPFERTTNNTLPQKFENHCITSSSYWIILLVTVLLRTLYMGTRLGLGFHPCPSFLALQYINICVDRGKFRAYFKLLQNSPKTHREKRSKTVSYTSLPQDLDCEQSLIFLCKVTTRKTLACSKRSDSGERCEVKKAMKSRGGPLLLPRFYFFALLLTSHRSPLSERLEQASKT